MCHTIDLRDFDWYVFGFHVLREGFPGGSQALAPHAPGSVEGDECKLIRLHVFVKGIGGKRDGMLAVLQKYLKFGMVVIVEDFALFPVAALEKPTPPFLVKVPFFNVLGDVHAVGAQDVEYIHDSEATGKIEHGDVEVYPNL
eukprot:evm.model.NODE_4194_length_22161_cov_20.701637.1